MHTRIIPLLLILLFAASTTFAQKKKKDSSPAVPPPPKTEQVLVKMYEDILEQSLSFNDLAIATQATYALMVLKPEDSLRLDTLTAIYFQRGAYPQTVMTGTKVLEDRPNNLEIMEMVAISKGQLGASLEALQDYEKLYQLSGDSYHLYEIASLQYSIRRYGECENSVKRLLQSEGNAEKEVTLTFKQGQQKVPLNAAVYNLWGVLDLDQGKTESAKQHFEKAVQLFPDFYLAKGNLDALAKGKAEGDK